MMREEMVIACCTDLAGKVRGKAFPAVQFDKRRKRGIGWTPTNVQITCFDAIAESPFGSFGDLVLIPDQSARVRVDFGDGEPAEHFALGDIMHTDGRPWELCTRSILKAALERLETLTGLTLFGAFEHEFQFRNRLAPQGDPAPLERLLQQSRLPRPRGLGPHLPGLGSERYRQVEAVQFRVPRG
jgi:glutamine synthetase